MTNYEVIRLIVLGNSGIGKTGVIKHVCNTTFYGGKTIGVDYDIKFIQHEGNKYKLQFWDCAGDERFSNIIRAYYKNSKYIIIFFNADDMSYKSNISYWIEELNFNKEIYKYSILLIGLYSNNICLENVKDYIEEDIHHRYIFLNKKAIDSNNLIKTIVEMYKEDNLQKKEDNINTKLLNNNRHCYEYCNIL